MPKRVWKLTVDPRTYDDAGRHARLPSGARPLATAEQYGVVAVWFEVDPDVLHTDVVLYLVPTGGGPCEGMEYVGTALAYGGGVVLHVYYTQEPLPVVEEN